MFPNHVVYYFSSPGKPIMLLPGNCSSLQSKGDGFESCIMKMKTADMFRKVCSIYFFFISFGYEFMRLSLLDYYISCLTIFTLSINEQG